MNKKILALTVPNIITNITVPLLGMVDLAIVGRIEEGIYLGAIAIGTTIFNLLYWGFGFLRMGTTGFAAQALGGRNLSNCALILMRSSIVAVVIGVLFLLFQYPIFSVVKQFMNISDAMLPEVEKYFYIRIWAAPAVMMLYTIKGWLLGMQNARLPMAIAILINVTNIFCSYIFAFNYDMGLSGVALGTVIAQYGGLLLGLIVVAYYYRKIVRRTVLSKIFTIREMKQFFSINSTIFIRSLGLILVFTFFTSASSSMGDDVLNANTLLLQLFTLFSYLMDGFAYAAESLTGKYYGANDQSRLKRVVKLVLYWGVGITIVFTLLYSFALSPILSVFTDNEGIVNKAIEYKYWVMLVPFSGFLAFIYDGIATGLLKAKAMRDTIIVATILFFIIYYALINVMENNALWIAFLIFLIYRGVSLHFIIKKQLSV